MSASTHADRTHKRQRTLRHEPLEERCLLAGDAAAAINQFAFDLYQHMQHEEGNLFFSPLSISTAMGMAYAGAAGQTAAEIEQVFHFGGSEDIHAAFGELLTSLAERTGEDPPAPWPLSGDPPDWWYSGRSINYQVEVSNAIWPDDGVALLPEYTNLVSGFYGAYVEEVDYADTVEAEKTINDWVSQRTRGRIQDLVRNLTPLTQVVLTNSVYYNAAWDSPFDPAHTSSGTFTTPDGDGVVTQLMLGHPNHYRTSLSGFDILELPMSEGQASMILMMPLSEDAPNVVSSELMNGVEDWLGNSDRGRQDNEVFLPRIEIGVETGLNQALADMGMGTAFTPGAADFSAMTPAGVFIKDVFHKADLSITEEGTTAAAATKIEFGLCFAAGTPVLTPEGAKAIEDVKIGDLVLARNEHLLEGEVEPKVVEGCRHGEAEIVELHLGRRVIRTTDLHPFFVEGHGWLAAAKIKAGDRLACDRGGSIVVAHIERTGRVEEVFNLKVADHRTFFIGDADWGFGVWTHNYYEAGYYANRQFHFMIRDNVTDTIAFMGRIDDPTQLANTVTPQVIESNADWGDFDNSGVVDQADYALWRSSYGQTGSRLQADGNGDGRVDSADYTVWRDNLGATAAAPLVVEAVADADEAVVDEQPAPAAPLVATPSPRPQRSLGGPVRPQRALSSTEAEPDLLLLLAAQRQRATQAEQLNAHVETGETAEEEPVREVFATVESWLESPL